MFSFFLSFLYVLLFFSRWDCRASVFLGSSRLLSPELRPDTARLLRPQGASKRRCCADFAAVCGPWTWTRADRFHFDLKLFPFFGPQSREMSPMIPELSANYPQTRSRSGYAHRGPHSRAEPSRAERSRGGLSDKQINNKWMKELEMKTIKSGEEEALLTSESSIQTN